ncbi:MAG: thioredoxin family protein, partial [Chitinophagaceae bacterium]|nr:thioredoxin family protein [Chitinophagaceae bacterium]
MISVKNCAWHKRALKFIFETFIIVLLLIPNVASSQKNTTYKGIKWTEGLSWEQVKLKAKKENKYIFLDVYATWCGPCKAMDEAVYPVDSVGEYFNDRFISIKVQMDETKNDNELVIAWREDAKQIEKEFEADALPTFLFFSPSGKLVHKETGYRSSGDFLCIGRIATQPGRVYKDPNETYKQKVDDFLAGKIQPDSMFTYYEFLGAIRKTNLMQKVGRELYKYLGDQPIENLFTMDRIKFIASVTATKTDRWFPLFYHHATRVNKVMKDDNYSERLVQE